MKFKVNFCFALAGTSFAIPDTLAVLLKSTQPYQSLRNICTDLWKCEYVYKIYELIQAQLGRRSV